MWTIRLPWKARLLWCAAAAALVGGCGYSEPPESVARVQDQEAMQGLRAALLALPSPEPRGPGSPGEPAAVQAEAGVIAVRLVEHTRELNRRFQMATSPSWHNVLIRVGAKQNGLCFEWVKALLAAFPPGPLVHFERRWGWSQMSEKRENNALVLTRRGAPLESGLLYDAWRGAGRPFWIRAAVDREWTGWQERFSEEQILRGEAHVVPAR